MSQQNNTTETQSMQERFPRTIPQEVFDAWQILRQVGDAEKLCTLLKKSRPVVDRALNYGHVKKPVMADKISEFFQKRIEKQKGKGERLLTAVKS